MFLIVLIYLQYYIYYGQYRSSQSLLVVKHESMYNFYISDKTGTYYSLSLEDIVADDNEEDITIVRNELNIYLHI